MTFAPQITIQDDELALFTRLFFEAARETGIRKSDFNPKAVLAPRHLSPDDHAYVAKILEASGKRDWYVPHELENFANSMRVHLAWARRGNYQ